MSQSEQPKKAQENQSPSSQAATPPVSGTPKIKLPTKATGNEKKETPSLIRKKPSPVEKKQVKEEVLQEELTNDFTDEQLQDTWIKFKAERLETGASDTEQLVLKRELVKEGEHDVKILLESQLEISILERIEQQLIQHLRKTLANTKIQLMKEVSDQVVTRNLYTSREKYEYMAQQNPALQELKERLGLDFDF